MSSCAPPLPPTPLRHSRTHTYTHTHTHKHTSTLTQHATHNTHLLCGNRPCRQRMRRWRGALRSLPPSRRWLPQQPGARARRSWRRWLPARRSAFCSERSPPAFTPTPCRTHRRRAVAHVRIFISLAFPVGRLADLAGSAAPPQPVVSRPAVDLLELFAAPPPAPPAPATTAPAPFDPFTDPKSLTNSEGKD